MQLIKMTVRNKEVNMIPTSPADRNTIMLFSMPIVYIVFGVLLLLPNNIIKPIVFSYLFGAALIIGGAAAVIKYFITKGYNSYYSYDFSIGLIAVLLGIIALIKAGELASSIMFIIGIAILLSSVLKIQNAIQLVIKKNKLWIPVLSVAVVFVIASILILINLNSGSGWTTFTYIMLVIVGVVSLATNIYMYISIGKKHKAMPPLSI